MVRLWDPEKDFKTVLGFLFTYQLENQNWIAEPDDSIVTRRLVQCVTDEEPVFIFEKDGVMQGILILSKGQEWWSGQYFLMNLVWHVRDGQKSVKLLREFLEKAKQYAILKELPLYVELPSSLAKINKVEKVFKKYGFNFNMGIFKAGK